MKSIVSALFAVVAGATMLVVGTTRATAQTAVVGPKNIELKSIQPSVTTTPEYTVKNTTDKRAQYLKWLEIEVEFDTQGVDLIDELTFEYLVEVNGTLCPGEITHVNIAKGRGHYSVMYIGPRNLDRLTNGKPLNAADIGNMWVTVKKQGQELAKKSLKPGNPRNLKQFPGLLVQKSETPFQVLWWDRYEAVKANR